jgi:hypothetical protein
MWDGATATPADGDYGDGMPKRSPVVRAIAAVTAAALVLGGSGVLVYMVVAEPAPSRPCPDSPVHDIDVRGMRPADADARLTDPDLACDGETIRVTVVETRECGLRDAGTIAGAGAIRRAASGDLVLPVAVCGGPAETAAGRYPAAEALPPAATYSRSTSSTSLKL